MGVDGRGLQADSYLKSVGFAWGLAATWRWVCIYEMNRVNSGSGHAITAPLM